MNEQPMYALSKYHLPEDNKQEILALFQCLSSGLCEKAEDILIALLESILERNPENAIDGGDDFDTIHMLNNSFDKTYQQWCELSGQRTANTTRLSSDNDLLLFCCFDRTRARNLLWGIYTYLEGDYPPPHQSLVKELQEYKRLRAKQENK